jgi:sulfoxide reductase heme-binding subunit YedZ
VAASVGFTSLFLLWLAVVLGITLARGWALTRVKHATMYGAHMVVALFGLILAAVHAFAQLAVPGGTVTLVQEFVPFLNPRDRYGIGIGVIALELMVSLAVSVLVQRRLGYHRWKALHVLAYVTYTLLTAHVLLSGSEAGAPLVYVPVLVAWLTTIVLWMSISQWAAKQRDTAADRIRGRMRGQQAVVQVDPGKCARFGFCEHEAPKLFELRGDRLSYRAAVPAKEVENVIRAAQVCPARAIHVNQAASRVLVAQRPAGEPAGAGAGGERMASVTGLRQPRGGR